MAAADYEQQADQTSSDAPCINVGIPLVNYDELLCHFMWAGWTDDDDAISTTGTSPRDLRPERYVRECGPTPHGRQSAQDAVKTAPTLSQTIALPELPQEYVQAIGSNQTALTTFATESKSTTQKRTSSGKAK